MSIPPIPDLQTGAATCPVGYAYNPITNMCDPQDHPIQVTTTDPATGNTWTINDINKVVTNPTDSGLKRALGALLSGILERHWTLAWHSLGIVTDDVLRFWFSKMDSWFAIVADALTFAQAENTKGFFELSAALVTNLFGIQVDPATLEREYKSGGRLNSVRGLGRNVVDLLASEFAGVEQGGIPDSYTVPAGSGIGGLPATQLSPEQGVKGAAAFLGFVSEFAVREGNSEMLAGSMPWGLGEGVREMAVEMASSLHLSRMTRIALHPLFKTLVATPLEWALNVQYRPKIFGAAEAVWAQHLDVFDETALGQELQYAGWSDARQGALVYMHSEHLKPEEVLALVAKGDLNYTDYSVRVKKLKWDVDEADEKLRAMEIQPARRVAINAAERIIARYVAGEVDFATVKAFITSIPVLTDGERKNLLALLDTLQAQVTTHTKTLSVGQIEQAFAEGFITLGEMETRFAAHGFPADDVSVLTFLALIKSQQYEVAAAAMAKRAAKLGITLTKPPVL